jgi:glycosyltransferase involved in cell wall biosynthesis
VKIAYVITRADAVGGASIHVRDLAQAMLERGHQAVVLVGGLGPVTDQLASAGVPFRSLENLQRSIHPVRDFRARAEMIAVLRELQPDLVSTHTAKAGWIGRAVGAQLRLPALYTPHGWSIGNRISPTLSAVFAVAERAAAKWASAIVCVCEYERRLAIEKGIAAPEKLVVVHNGMRDIPAELHAEPGLRPVRLCSVARFESPKDHATLLRALAPLRKKDWQIDLIGDGPLEPEMRRLAAALHIADRVRFLGYVPDPAPVLARAQLFVLSSRSEAFPRSVLEGMRAGLPVVASDVGGVGEAVTDGVNGLLVRTRSVDALSAALAGMIENASRRQLFGKAARHVFEERFRLERMVEQTAAVYATVLSRTAKIQGIA